MKPKTLTDLEIAIKIEEIERVEIMKGDKKSGMYDKPNVKLYTEEQVNYAIYLALNEFSLKVSTHEKILNSLTPIELPSDEELLSASPIVNVNAHDYYFGHLYGFIDGAKWMRDKLTNTKDK